MSDTPITDQVRISVSSDADGQNYEHATPDGDYCFASDMRALELAANGLRDAARRYIRAIPGAIDGGSMDEMRAASRDMESAIAAFEKLKP